MIIGLVFPVLINTHICYYTVLVYNITNNTVYLFSVKSIYITLHTYPSHTFYTRINV